MQEGVRRAHGQGQIPRGSLPISHTRRRSVVMRSLPPVLPGGFGGQGTLCQVVRHDALYAPGLGGLLAGRDKLLPAALLVRPPLEVGVGHAPLAPLRCDVVDGVGKLDVSGALRPHQKPVQFLAGFLRLEEVEAVVDAVIGAPPEGAYLRLLYIVGVLRVGGLEERLLCLLRPLADLLLGCFAGLGVFRSRPLADLSYAPLFGLFGEVWIGADLLHLDVASVDYLYRVRCHLMLLPVEHPSTSRPSPHGWLSEPQEQPCAGRLAPGGTRTT